MSGDSAQQHTADSIQQLPVQEQISFLLQAASATDSQLRALSSVVLWLLPQLNQEKAITAAALRDQATIWDRNFEAWRGPLTDRELWRQAIDELETAIG